MEKVPTGKKLSCGDVWLPAEHKKITGWLSFGFRWLTDKVAESPN